MPNRIIKESICTSDEIDALTAEQEVFFYRLMVVVDDFGLIDARLPILKSKCYPLKSIEISEIQANLGRLVAVGLVSLYRADGKPYLSITSWAKHQQIRAQRAKCPMPEQGIEINCNQLLSDAPVIQSNPIRNQSESESESESNQAAPKKPVRFDPCTLEMPEGFSQSKWAEWVGYRLKTGKALKPESWEKQVEFIAECIGKGIDVGAIIDNSIRNGYTGLFEPKQQQTKGGAQFLTAQQQRDENNRRSTAEFLADDTPVFGYHGEPIEGECSNA